MPCMQQRMTGGTPSPSPATEAAMFRRIFSECHNRRRCWLGVVSALLQHLVTTPLILKAETFEGPLIARNGS